MPTILQMKGIGRKYLKIINKTPISELYLGANRTDPTLPD